MSAGPDSGDSARRILIATGIALAAALVTLVAFVLPAEYGIDPLGSGRVTGLLALAELEKDALAVDQRPYAPDQVAFRLEPFESVEYKYRLETDQALVYAWRASGDVVAELHAEPDGAPEGFAESFRRSRGASDQGSYRAPFAGWHGWFWENRGVDAVTVELEAAGFFSAARTYGGGRVSERVLVPGVEKAAGDSAVDG
ncbi:MAG: hypothetical protein RIC56_02270 [Pseudomonadales bacterium]